MVEYGLENYAFKLFDVYTGAYWMGQGDITLLARAYGIDHARIHREKMTMREAINLVATRPRIDAWVDQEGELHYYEVEGLVLKMPGVYDRNGIQLMTKIKTRDFS